MPIAVQVDLQVDTHQEVASHHPALASEAHQVASPAVDQDSEEVCDKNNK